MIRIPWNKLFLNEELVIQNYQELKSLRKVAKIFNCSTPTIQKVLQQHNIKVDGKMIHTFEIRKAQGERLKNLWKTGVFDKENHSQWKGGKKEYHCSICKKSVFRWESQIKHNKKDILCSNECRKIFAKDIGRKSNLGHLRKSDGLPIQLSGEKHYNWKGGKQERFCIICNKIVYRTLTDIRLNKNGFICSSECRKKFGKQLYKTTLQPILRSMPSYWLGKRGKDAMGWKGGKDPLSLRIRRIPEYIQWRNQIFSRDNYSCQKCGKTDCYVCAHHPTSFSILLKQYEIRSINDAINCKDLWKSNNGITYCWQCHKDFHKQYGKIVVNNRTYKKINDV